MHTTCTFERYKFSPLIGLSYAEFGLSYTADEQTFQATAQWPYLSAKQTFQFMHGLSALLSVFIK